MKKRWLILPTDPADVQHLQDVLKIHPVFCQLLVQRGIKTYDEAKRFFRPSIEHLHDPFLMKDMDKAVHRLAHAIQQQEKILLYGDYDVDGTTSVALLHSFLEKHHSLLEYYIPDRYHEGYGVSSQGIDYAAKNDFTLIIAMDCGIKAVDQVEAARSKGIDFIICDHHLPETKIPDAVAVLDPKRTDCSYPYKELSGCGVTLKLVQGFIKKQNIPESEWISLLDFVVISIACDIVPMTGENRILAFFGLQQINTTQRPGLLSLIHTSQRAIPMNINDLVFGLGPMINAAGRLADAKQAVQLLLAKDTSSAQDFARVLQQQNQQRKNIDQQVAQEAKMMVEEDSSLAHKKSIVLFHAHWHKGIVGIAASRVVESFHRPTIILTESNGLAVGSARSVKGFDIHAAIKKCQHLLINFGGHAHAAGLTLSLENINLFRQTFEEAVQESILQENLTPEINIAAPLHFEAITPSFFRILKQFAPFGPKNRNPVFGTKNVNDFGYSRLLKGNHLKLTVKEYASITMQGIAFGMGDFFPKIKNQYFHIAYTVNENTWQGKTSLQLNVKDIKVVE